MVQNTGDLRVKNICITILATFLLAACTSGESSTEPSPEPEAPAAEAAPAADAAPEAEAAAATDGHHGDHGHDHGADAAPEASATDAATPEGQAAAASDGHHGDHSHGAEKAACACAQGKDGQPVWCEECGSGWVAGAKITDHKAYLAAIAAPTADESAAH